MDKEMYGLSDFQVYYLGFLYTQNWHLVLHLQTCTWYKMLNYIEYAVWYVYYEQQHQYKTCMLNFGGKWVIGVFTHEQIQAITRCIYSI